jgi:hypothetical protein
MGRHGCPASCPHPQRVPRLSACRNPASWQRAACLHACAPVSRDVRAVHSRAPVSAAASPALQALCISLFSAGGPSPVTRPVCALRRGPAACRRPLGLRQPLTRRGVVPGGAGEHRRGAERRWRLGARAKWLYISYTLRIEQRRQGEAGTDNHKRMHSHCYSMQRRVVQEHMEFRSHGRVRKIFQIMGHKAQR